MKLRAARGAAEDDAGEGGAAPAGPLRSAREWGRIEVLPGVVAALAANAATG
jgi:hypothetical protein